MFRVVRKPNIYLCPIHLKIIKSIDSKLKCSLSMQVSTLVRGRIGAQAFGATLLSWLWFSPVYVPDVYGSLSWSEAELGLSGWSWTSELTPVFHWCLCNGNVSVCLREQEQCRSMKFWNRSLVWTGETAGVVLAGLQEPHVVFNLLPLHWGWDQESLLVLFKNRVLVSL